MLFLCLQLIQLIKPLMLPGVSPLLTSFLTKEQDSLLWLEMAYLNWGLAAFTAFTMAASELVARCFFNRLSISMMAIDINTSAQTGTYYITRLCRPHNHHPQSNGDIANFIKFTGLNVAFAGMVSIKLLVCLVMKKSSMDGSYGVMLAMSLVRNTNIVEIIETYLKGFALCDEQESTGAQ